jgi:hypothetical protein
MAHVATDQGGVQKETQANGKRDNAKCAGHPSVVFHAPDERKSKHVTNRTRDQDSERREWAAGASSACMAH